MDSESTVTSCDVEEALRVVERGTSNRIIEWVWAATAIASETLKLRTQLTAALARADKAEKERDAYAKAKAENDERFQIEAGTYKALYAKAWEECGTWRYANGARTESGWTSTRYAGDGEYYADYPNHAADAHDAARKAAGLDAAKPQE